MIITQTLNKNIIDTISPELQMAVHRSKNEDTIVPFRYFEQPKPMHGRHKAETYTIEGAIKIILQYDEWTKHLSQGPGKGIIVEPKYDGLRLQVHKINNQIHAWTEDGTDVTKNIPTVLKQLIINTHDFVIEGELELWENNTHKHRAKATAIINTTQIHPEEPNSRFTIYDVMWLDGEDIHKMPFNYRSKAFIYFNKLLTPNLDITRQELARSKNQLIDLINELSIIEGSEGVMLKLPNYRYSLTGTTRSVIKYKKELSLDVKIVYSDPVEGTASTFNHDCVLINNTGEDVYIGTTYNTNITSPTNIIQVAFTELAEYTDPNSGKVHFRWMFPRVISARQDKTEPDTVDTAHQIVLETKGTTASRKYPTQRETPVQQPIQVQQPNQEPIINTDCNCNNKLLINFKIQKHTWQSQDSKTIKSEYHLLFEMPTRHLDFISQKTPINSAAIDTILETASTARWNLNGTLSPQHKLNPIKNIKSTIETIDIGTAIYNLSASPSEMIITLDGLNSKSNVILIQEKNTQVWHLHQH